MTSTDNLCQIDPSDILCHPNAFEAGSGSFGDVLIGYYVVLGIFVAVKVFPVDSGRRGTTLAKKRVEEEIRHLRKVNHENIVRYIGWVKWPFTVGIVMEYCEGGNLKNLLLDPNIPLSVPLRVRMLLDIAKALASCHTLRGKRLVHGDVKPANCLITKKFICKVCDFGSAEMATTTGSMTMEALFQLQRSKKDRIQLTKLYTAPEKLQDPGMKPTKQLDVYTFAMLIHMFLTRDNLYPLGDEKSLVDAIKQGRRPNCHKIEELKQALNENKRRIVEELEQMMKQCWDQDPSARPTMTEVSKRLQQLLDQQDREVLEQQVVEVIRKMDIKDPFSVDNQENLLLICRFSTRTRRFEDQTPSASPQTRNDFSDGRLILGTQPACGDGDERTEGASTAYFAFDDDKTPNGSDIEGSLTPFIQILDGAGETDGAGRTFDTAQPSSTTPAVQEHAGDGQSGNEALLNVAKSSTTSINEHNRDTTRRTIVQINLTRRQQRWFWALIVMFVVSVPSIITYLLVDDSIKQSNLSGCEKNTVQNLTAMTGNIKSVNYPNLYAPNQHCEWNIIAKGRPLIQLTFHEIDLWESTDCQSHYVSIYDGLVDGYLLGKYCDIPKAQPLVAHSGSMKIVFVSGSYTQDRGFIATYVIQPLETTTLMPNTSSSTVQG